MLRFFLLTFAVTASMALAHAGATGIVKERMDGMVVLQKAVKSLSTMNKSGDVDQADVAELARTVQAHAGRAMTSRFPEGSLPHVSEASPAIWNEFERFEALSDDLLGAAVALETAAISGELDLAASMAEIGQSCKSCHRDYRIKK